MKIIGHRGSSGTAPENTLKAINLAWEEGADGVEIDVRLTKDAQIVLIHDKTVWRTAGGREWVVHRCDLEKLRRLNFGQGEKIPTLQEALEALPKDKELYIEIKDKNVLDHLSKAINEVDQSQLVISSFHLEDVKRVKEEFPQMRSYWIKGMHSYFKEARRIKKYYTKGIRSKTVFAHRKPKIQKAIDKLSNGASAEFLGKDLDGVVLNNYFLTGKMVKTLQVAGMEVIVWLVKDTVKAAQQVKCMGVDGVILNSPGRAIKELA
jgi:glycerophosphoryl diester phosphodiesterase